MKYYKIFDIAYGLFVIAVFLLGLFVAPEILASEEWPRVFLEISNNRFNSLITLPLLIGCVIVLSFTKLRQGYLPWYLSGATFGVGLMFLYESLAVFVLLVGFSVSLKINENKT